VAPGFNDTLFQQSSLIQASGLAVALMSYYWTVNGVQQGGAVTPLEPVASATFGFPGNYSFTLQNNTPLDLLYDSLNLTVNGSQILSNASGTVLGNTTATLAGGIGAPVSFDYSFRDLSSGVTEVLTFAPTPEPGTLLSMSALLAAAVGFSRLRARR